MFGGLSFLIRERITINASGQGGILVPAGPGQRQDLLDSTAATIAVMGGREMSGWLRVAAEHVPTDAELSRWAELSIEHARSLGPK